MHIRRLALLVIALAITLPSLSAAQDSPDQMLLGKWKHVSLQRKIDGQLTAPQVSDGMTFAEYFPNGTWTLKSQTNLAGGTYKWVDAKSVEQTILESGLAIQIGVVSVKQIRVTTDRLEIIIVQTAKEMGKFMPPSKTGTNRPNEVVITSVFSRVVPE